MSRDMRKVPLGTHQTPIGSHPECPETKDQTPVWLVFVSLIILAVALVMFLIDYFSTPMGVNSVFYSEILLFVLGILSLLRVLFNWKNKSTRYSEMILFVLYTGTGFALIFKP